jgi:hypothetical protein
LEAAAAAATGELLKVPAGSLTSAGGVGKVSADAAASKSITSLSASQSSVSDELNIGSLKLASTTVTPSDVPAAAAVTEDRLLVECALADNWFEADVESFIDYELIYLQ